MGRGKSTDPESTISSRLILLLVCLVSCGLVYAFVSAVVTTTQTPSAAEFESLALIEHGATHAVAENYGGDNRGCCRGIENLELWGAAVKWGSEFKFNNSEGCCNACKSMCTGTDGPCLCDTWVFCGNRETCGSKFGEVGYFCNSTLFEDLRVLSFDLILYDDDIVVGVAVSPFFFVGYKPDF